MKWTTEHSKILATILFAEKGMGTLKGGKFWAVFAEEDIPETNDLVVHGYLLQERNPAKIGPRYSFALTKKGREVAEKVPLSEELQNTKMNFREADLNEILRNDES